MAKDQACKLQILSAEHPDILQAADAMFDKYLNVGQVRRMIERVYHLDVGDTAVRTYKQKYWQARKDAINERLTAMKAVSQLVGEDGLTAAVNALLWESLQEMTVPQLMAFKKVMNDAQKVELMKKQFALYAQEQRQKMKERANAMKATQVDAEVVDDYEAAQKVVEQVKEIFGIGTRQLAPAPQKLLGPAQGVPPPVAVVAGGNERS